MRFPRGSGRRSRRKGRGGLSVWDSFARPHDPVVFAVLAVVANANDPALPPDPMLASGAGSTPGRCVPRGTGLESRPPRRRGYPRPTSFSFANGGVGVGEAPVPPSVIDRGLFVVVRSQQPVRRPDEDVLTGSRGSVEVIVPRALARGDQVEAARGGGTGAKAFRLPLIHVLNSIRVLGEERIRGLEKGAFPTEAQVRDQRVGAHRDRRLNIRADRLQG